MFQRLSNSATTASLLALVEYVADNWITSTMWPPSCWSVYMLPIRTNNDIEGWHHSLNRRANNRAPAFLPASGAAAPGSQASINPDPTGV